MYNSEDFKRLMEKKSELFNEIEEYGLAMSYASTYYKKSKIKRLIEALEVEIEAIDEKIKTEFPADWRLGYAIYGTEFYNMLKDNK